MAPEDRAGDAPTLWWRILLYLALVIAGLGLLGPLGFARAGMAGSVTALLVSATAAGWFMLRLDGHPPRALGLGLRPTAGVELVLGTLLGLAALAPVLGLLALTGSFGLTADPDGPAGWSATGAVAVESLLFLGVAAAGEEVLVRGYPLQLLSRAWGPLPALGATSVVFGLVHLGNPSLGWVAMVNLVLAGLFLGALVLRTGSLWWATGAHLGWNWGQAFLADIPVSGLEVVDAPAWEGVLRGPVWWSGGAFGLEGSVLAALALGGAALWSWRRRRWRPTGPRWWRDEDEQDGAGATGAADEPTKESTTA